MIKVLDVMVLSENFVDGDYIQSLVEDHLVTSYQSLSILLINTITKNVGPSSLDDCTLEALREKYHQIKNRNHIDCPEEYMPLLERAWECQNKFKRLSFRVKERFLDKHWV